MNPKNRPDTTLRMTIVFQSHACRVCAALLGAVLVLAVALLALGAGAARTRAAPALLCVSPTGGGCSFNKIQDAINAVPPGGIDRIVILPGTYTENLTIGNSKQLTFSGQRGADQTFIDGGNNGRVISVTSGASLTLYGVTVQHGQFPVGSGGRGGGIRVENGASLSVWNSTIRWNQADYGGAIIAEANSVIEIHASSLNNNHVSTDGGAFNNGSSRALIDASDFEWNSGGYGGAIYNYYAPGALSIVDSTVANNQGQYDGGGIFTLGVLTLTASTLGPNNYVGDSSLAEDGGAMLVLSGTVSVHNSTISGNRARKAGGGIALDGGVLLLQNATVGFNTANVFGLFPFGGGGIFAAGTAYGTLVNTIVANNWNNDDCEGPLRLTGDNFIRNTGKCTLTGSISPGNLVTGTDPLLVPLQDNGGATPTHALLPGSPAINKGDNGLCLPTDQRGFARPRTPQDPCDLGAFEAPPPILLPLIQR